MDIKNKSSLLFGEGWVMHARPLQQGREKKWFFSRASQSLKHSFRYPIFNILVPVRADGVLQELGHGFFISLSSQDYLYGKKSSLKDNIEQFLSSELGYSCDQIWLQTLPRMFGYVFNPVSFWFCYKNEKLDAVLCEVNNTFGDRHFYFICDLGKNLNSERRLAKQFHVSPFFSMKGHYTFEFLKNDKMSDIQIRLYHDDELKLDTRIMLKIRPYSEISNFYILKNYGWLTLLIIFKIHIQALRLWIKGAVFFRRPSPPKENVTYDFTGSKQ